MDVNAVPHTLAGPEGETIALRAGAGAVQGGDRDKLLADLRAGNGPTRLTIDAIVFRQREAPNRNFVRFKPSTLNRFAKSFVGQPFLRDHDRFDLLARGGTIVASELIDMKDGPAIQQSIELVKPWAIEAALDGTLDRFSIGWHNTAEVLCSVCDEPMFRSSKCSHWPGDKVELKGETLVVEMVVTGPDGTETSGVSVPAVKGTSVEAVRSALATLRSQRPPTKERTMLKLAAIVAAACGLSAEADESVLCAGVETLGARLTAEKQAREAKEKELAEVVTDRDRLRAADFERTVGALIEEAHRGGKLQGVMKDGRLLLGDKENPIAVTIRSLASTDVAAARALVESLPRVTGAGAALRSNDPPPPGPGPGEGMTEQRLLVMRQLGVTKEEQERATKHAQLTGRGA